MNYEMTAILEGLSSLGLGSMPTDEYNTWMNSESPDVMAIPDNEPVEGSLSGDFIHLSGAINSWISSANTGKDAQAALWDTISTVCPVAHKALLMTIQSCITKYLSSPPRPCFDATSSQAATAAAFYFTLLRVPGCKAYGVFDQSLVRRCMAVTKRMLEIAALTLPGRIVKKSRAAPTAAGSRRINRRGSARTDDDGDETMGREAAHSEDEAEPADDDEDFGSKSKKVTRTGKRATTEGAGGEFTVDAEFIDELRFAVFALCGMTKDLSLKAQPELTPLVLDVALATLQLPVHVEQATTADESTMEINDFGSSTSSASSFVSIALLLILLLVRPIHGSPLTSARLVCKKLKPLLMQGSAMASSISLSFGISGDDDDAPLSQFAGAALPQLAKPVDSKLVRARAAAIVQGIVSNSTDASVSPAAAAAIPQEVLCRLPAVAALMQHLCVSSVTAKAEVRAHATEVIAYIRSCLPHSLRRAFVRFLTKFGRSGRIQYRQFGVELAARLLGVSVSSSAGLGTAAHGAGAVEATVRNIYVEASVPTAEEKLQESEGYDDEVLNYAAPNNMDDDAGDEDEEEPALDVGTPRAKKTKSRPSICAFGNDISMTPARKSQAAMMTPSAADTISKHKSPFYFTGNSKAGKHVKRRSSVGSVSSAYSLATDATEGCSDPRPTATVLLDYLLHRASDKSPAVRTRSITMMGELLSLDSHMYARENACLLSFLNMKVLGSNSAASPSNTTTGEITMADTTIGGILSTTIMDPCNATSIAVKPTGGCSSLVPLFLRRMEEESKPALKRAAIIALNALAQSGSSVFIACPPLASVSAALEHTQLVELHNGVQAKCMDVGAVATAPAPSRVIGLYALESIAAKGADTSVLVRKAALTAVHSMLTLEPSCSATQQLWLATVLPLVFDAEPTVVAKVIDCTCSAIFEGLIGWYSVAHAKAGHKTPTTPVSSAWRMLGMIGTSDDLRASLSQVVFLCIRAAVSATKADASTFKIGTLVPVLLDAFDLAASAGSTMDTTDDSFVSPIVLRRSSWLLASVVASQLFGEKQRASLIAADAGNKYLAAVSKQVLELHAPALKAWAKLSAEVKSSAASSTTTMNTTLNDTSSSIALHFPTDQAELDAETMGSISDACNCLNVIALLCKNAGSTSHVAHFLDGITKDLCTFIWPPQLISAATEACVALSISFCKSKVEATSALQHWCRSPLEACESAMVKYLSLNSQSELDKYASIMTSVMFLLGECAAIGLEANSGQGVQEKAVEDGNIKPRAIDIPASLVTLVQALLAPSIVSSTASIESAVISVPEVVRAHAYLCLGKFCLRDAALAKRYITVFIRDLSAATSPMSVRNNILFVLGDLCVRYTALVDRYIPSLAACVTDSHPAIRKHAVILLTQLVVEEYVKFRGPLFYRLAGALADSDETVRQCAEAAVTGTLMSKYKTAFTSHFIGLLFVSTGCANSTAFRHLLGGIESEGVAGEATIASDRFMEFAMPSTARRHHIYSTLIKALPDDQKLVVYGKLASDVLGAVTEGTVHLTHAKTAGAVFTETFQIGSTELLVADAFTMMSLKDMRAAVSSRGVGHKVDAGEDEPEAQFGGEMDVGGAAAVAKSKVIGKLVKRQMIENILPICLGLRQFLTAQRSPLMQQLLGYLKVLSEDHADELKDALVSDRQTAAELEFDLRIWTEQATLRAASQGTPGRRALVRSHTEPLAATPARMAPLAPSTPMAHRTPAGAGIVRTSTGALMTSPKLKAPTEASEEMESASAPVLAKKLTKGGKRSRKAGAAIEPAEPPMLLSPHPETGASAEAAAETWNVRVAPSPYKNTVMAEEEDEDGDEVMKENEAPVAPAGKSAASRASRALARASSRS